MQEVILNYTDYNLNLSLRAQYVNNKPGMTVYFVVRYFSITAGIQHSFLVCLYLVNARASLNRLDVQWMCESVRSLSVEADAVETTRVANRLTLAQVFIRSKQPRKYQQTKPQPCRVRFCQPCSKIENVTYTLIGEFCCW